MRLFIAIDLDEVLKDKILKIQRKIESLDIDCKFVELKNLHFTLKFLGEVDEGKISEVEKKIDEVIKNFTSFKINIHGLDYFGSQNYIKTLWINVKEGKDIILKLINELNTNLDYIRHEKYKPTAHLTIGRVKSDRNRELLLCEIERLKDVNIGEMYVKEIKLKKSVLSKRGPNYSDLKVFKLM